MSGVVSGRSVISWDETYLVVYNILGSFDCYNLRTQQKLHTYVADSKDQDIQSRRLLPCLFVHDDCFLLFGTSSGDAVLVDFEDCIRQNLRHGSKSWSLSQVHTLTVYLCVVPSAMSIQAIVSGCGFELRPPEALLTY